MVTSKYYPTVEAIEKASGVLEEILEPTPFQKNQNLSDIYGADVYLKREDLQMVRSYKIRGAYNKIRSLSQEQTERGIVCASAGNHAQGVALACNDLKIHGVIFMPITIFMVPGWHMIFSPGLIMSRRKLQRYRPVSVITEEAFTGTKTVWKSCALQMQMPFPILTVPPVCYIWHM